MGWSDLGTWTSVFENSEKDENENSINIKSALTYQSQGNIIHVKNNNKAIVIDGLKDYIVVDTEKVLLICPREHDQLIKDYVIGPEKFKKRGSFHVKTGIVSATFCL